MTPAREQIERARTLLLPIADLAVIMGPGAEDALRTLLLATAPPSEEELVQAADQYVGDPKACPCRRCAFLAGARREGRKANL
jgi:hypothetical protein